MQDVLNLLRSEDPTTSLLICDLEDGTPAYYGYCALNGVWMIKCFDSSAGTMRYAMGVSGYSSAWAGRAGLTYEIPPLLP